jgi:hypothetical protein
VGTHDLDLVHLLILPMLPALGAVLLSIGGTLYLVWFPLLAVDFLRQGRKNAAPERRSHPPDEDLNSAKPVFRLLVTSTGNENSIHWSQASTPASVMRTPEVS